MINKLKGTFCVWFGHTRIVQTFMGQITCCRCDDIIGDMLAGADNCNKRVILGHDCKVCRENYKELAWHEKLFVPDPFKKEDTK